MAEHVIRFERGLTLEQALALIEDESIENVREVAIFPPINACTEVSDEDSGKEDFLDLNNLPGAQLQAPAEIQTESTDEYSSEDNLPLSIWKRTCQNNRKKTNPKKKKIYNWVKEDLILPSIANSDMNLKYQSSSFPVVQFCRFFDDEVLDLIVNESNRYAAQINRKTIIEKSEIKSFIGILILSGYICVRRRRMYWERERDSHNDLVAEAMTRDKFEYIMTNLHVSDNTNDGIDHLVIPQPKQTRCRHCHERTITRCKKCDVGLHAYLKVTAERVQNLNVYELCTDVVEAIEIRSSVSPPYSHNSPTK
ncbi:piggyBac transposable element-derived protein 2-like [Harmonia axyridis]|uniref:piggyBac transposable element-derived protein 2-like n=1 Tax=Harmonia axyridis TaxID=115357 RepID=UPI001E279C71|nr:piggyBac transposable element-derived protein 2-like [Harmonia axyridis]